MRPTASWPSAIAALVLAMAGTTAGARAQCKLQQVEEWPVRHVHGHLVVAGTVNGQPVDVMLGTGSQRTVVLRSAAERLHLHRQWANGYPMLGIGGESRVEATTVGDLTVGRFESRGWRFLIPIDQHLDDGFDIVLGDDFFRSFDVEFDLAHDVVRLFRSHDCSGASLAYWSPAGATEAAIEPVFHLRPQIIFAALANGQPVRALLDSGATVSVLTTRDALTAGVTPQSAGSAASGAMTGFGEKAVDTWTGTFESFAIGDETIKNPRIRFADIYADTTFKLTGSRVPHKFDSQQPMLLGVDFLRAHRVLVAHSQRKVYLTYVGGPVFDATGLTPASSTWLAPISPRQ
jgi:predicted aspartyl protease